MSKVLDLVRKDSDVLLDEWLKGIKTGIRRRDLIDERELKTQTREVLSTLAGTPAETSLDDLSQPEWQPLKDLLASLSTSRAAQGFTPSETALFVMSLKS